MRLVDIDECNREQFCKDCDGKDSLISVEAAFDMLEALPTAKVIEDIRAEIEHEGAMFPDGEFFVSIDRINEIFDKYTDRKEQII